MPEAKRIRQLIDVSSERPNDRDIFVYDKNVGKWVPMRGDFDERYYPREEADEAFQPAGDYQPAGSYAPLNHASRHASGGADPLTPANIGASPTNHTHSQYAPTSHNHDERYYQQSATEISHTRLRATAGGGATLSGTTHGIQAGPTTSQNLAVGGSEIQSRFNGASSTLFLNPSGGVVQVGAVSGNAGQVATQGHLDGKANTNHNHTGVGQSQIPTAGIANLAVTAAKIASNSITGSELASNAVGTTHIANLAVTASKIAANSITGSELANNAVSSNHLNPDTSIYHRPTTSTFTTFLDIRSIVIVSGTYIIIGTADLMPQSAGSIWSLSLSIGGNFETDEMVFKCVENLQRQTIGKTWIVTVPTGLSTERTVRLRVSRVSGTGNATLYTDHTTYKQYRIG